MEKEIKKPTKLAICGKVISIEKIGEKSLAQFKQLQKCQSLRQPLYIRMHNVQSNRVIINMYSRGKI